MANLRAPSTVEARERGRKGGRASGEARRKKKLLRECLEGILASRVSDAEIKSQLAESGMEDSYQDAMSLALIKKAIQGDSKAFEVVRDTIGQKPPDKREDNAAPVTVVVRYDYGDD